MTIVRWIGIVALMVAPMVVAGCGDGRDEIRVLEEEPDALFAEKAAGAPDESNYPGSARVHQEMRVPTSRGLLGSIDLAMGGLSLAPMAHADTSARALVRHANLDLTVLSVDTAILHLTVVAKEHGGYVLSQERKELLSGRASGSIVLRIAAEETDDALDGIRRLGEVRSERVWADDVSDQYYDLQVRLANAHRARIKFEELLGTARRVEDVLKVQRELNRAIEQIDRMTGQRRRMVNQIRYSDVNIDLAEPVPVTEDPDSVIGQLAQALDGMVDTFWATIAGIMVVIGFIVPFAAVVLGALWLGARLSRRWRERRRQRKEIAGYADAAEQPGGAE
jgi:hypothetical protein